MPAVSSPYGVPPLILAQDYVKAREWWEKAAAQGNAGAQSNLGVMYEYGLGVAQDYAKTREWFEKAAAQGEAGAQYNLGVMYARGRGVAQNDAKAREWFEKAAAQTENAEVVCKARQALEQMREGR